MLIALTPEQEAWLTARVAAGAFVSIEEAAQRLLDERIAQFVVDEDDLEWTRPLLEEAEADLVRGDVLSLEEHRARNAARLAALRR